MRKTVVMVLLLGFAYRTALAKPTIVSIDFKGTADPTMVEIRGDSPLQFEKQENTADNQVILEFKDTDLSKTAARKIDTSSFDSKVTLISPYKADGAAGSARVVIQLREAGKADVVSEGNVVKVSIPRDEQEDVEPKASTAPEQPSTEKVDKLSEKLDEPEKPKTTLDEFEAGRGTKRFVGRPITLHVRDVDAADVFRMIGEASGFNIVLGDDVKGKVTLSLTEVPWDQALDLLLHTLHLGAERNNNILRIVTLQNLTNEKIEELKATQAAQASAPRVTRIFPISYANLADLQATLTKFAASTAGEGNMAAIVQADNRTNSLIIRDVPDNIEKIKKLIELLDTQTPQVMIEAKVVEATESFSKTIGGSIGFGNDLAGKPTGENYFASFSGANPVDQLLGSPGVFADGATIGTASSSSSGQSGQFGISPKINFISGIRRLNALLNIGESENQVKVVSSPKTIVLNKEKATIVQGTPVLLPGTTTMTAAGPVTTSNIQSANLSLSVKPTVTNDGSVLMDLAVTRDVPFNMGGGNFGVANRNLNTIVLVESGSTLVIGGVYTMTSSKASTGFPILRKIPILGVLFGSDSENTNRSELFIFITPRILNIREAGLNS